MTNYIYNSHGSAVGFWRPSLCVRIGWNTGGPLRDTHGHKTTGEYVGELYKDMVVDRHLGNLGNAGNPGSPGSPGNPGNRGAVNYGYPDVFEELLK